MNRAALVLPVCYLFLGLKYSTCSYRVKEFFYFNCVYSKCRSCLNCSNHILCNCMLFGMYKH